MGFDDLARHMASRDGKKKLAQGSNANQVVAEAARVDRQALADDPRPHEAITIGDGSGRHAGTGTPARSRDQPLAHYPKGTVSHAQAHTLPRRSQLDRSLNTEEGIMSLSFRPALFPVKDTSGEVMFDLMRTYQLLIFASLLFGCSDDGLSECVKKITPIVNYTTEPMLRELGLDDKRIKTIASALPGALCKDRYIASNMHCLSSDGTCITGPLASVAKNIPGPVPNPPSVQAFVAGLTATLDTIDRIDLASIDDTCPPLKSLSFVGYNYVAAIRDKRAYETKAGEVILGSGFHAREYINLSQHLAKPEMTLEESWSNYLLARSAGSGALGVIVPHDVHAPEANKLDPYTLGNKTFISGKLDGVVAIFEKGKIECAVPIHIRSSDVVSYQIRLDSLSDNTNAMYAVRDDFQNQLDRTLSHIARNVVRR